MENRPQRICLITPGHIASTPRLVKSADALQAAGYDVHVVASDHFAPVRPLDESIIRRARWHCHRVPAPGFFQRQADRVRRKGALQFLAAGARALGPATRALHPAHGRFSRLAASLRAGLYIGHTLGGLAAAATASAMTGARLGFDAEDWHREEIEDHLLAPGEKNARITLEELLIPRCDQLTAASPLIADAYASLWGRRPPVVLNVFPKSEAPAQPVAPGQRLASLYWFSQTIGPGRGLESVAAVLAALPDAWTLQLRGYPAAGYAKEFQGTLGPALAGRVVWLPPADPDEMVRLSAPHRVGLGVELSIPRNRDICLTNKIFTYLLAGTPVLLSDTAAHRLLAPDLGAAAAVADLADPAAMLAAIRRLERPEAATQAWSLGQTRYNWDYEQRHLLESVQEALAAPRRHHD